MLTTVCPIEIFFIKVRKLPYKKKKFDIDLKIYRISYFYNKKNS